jgi:flagellin-like hook-associated protein FlgL
LNKSLARLSSGSKIVDPTDDAGGLAVSMKLSAAINRNVRAQQNVQNSISLLQTQDGAMANIATILDRMSELKTMSLDITKNSQDVANYDAEFNQLQNQLTNIKNELFNGINLFTTSESNLSVYTTELGDSGSSSVSSPYQIERVAINGDATAKQYGYSTALDGDAGDSFDFVFTTADGNSIYSINVAWDTNAETTVRNIKSAIESHSDLKNLVTVNDNEDGTFEFIGQATAGDYTLAASAQEGTPAGTAAALGTAADVAYAADSYDLTIGGNALANVKWQGTKALTAAKVVEEIGNNAAISALVTAKVDGGDIVITAKASGANEITVTGTATEAGGATAATVTVNQDSQGSSTSTSSTSAAPTVEMSRHLIFETGTNGSGLITSGGIDLLDSSSAASMNLADYTVEDFTSFIQNAATARSQNGAETVRLQSSLNLLKTNEVNLSSARSLLADVDIARESTALARNNILVQSSAAMLAQANASQNVALSLLA